MKYLVYLMKCTRSDTDSMFKPKFESISNFSLFTFHFSFSFCPSTSQ